MENLVLEVAGIEWGVKRLHSNRYGGQSGIQAEHLRLWFVGDIYTSTTDSTNWLKVVDLVQTAFRDVLLS